MRNTTPIPTAKHPPLVGNLFEFRNDRLALQRRLVDEHGDRAWFHVGPVPVLMISSAELVHELLVERVDAFVKSAGLGKFGRPLLGNGLLTSEHEVHARQRKLLAPAFAHKRIAGYADTMARHADAAQSRWQDGATLDLAEEMMKLTLAIVGRTLFDVDVSGDARVVGEALTEAMQYMIDSVTSIPLPWSWPLPRNLRARRAVEELDQVVYRIIAERRAQPGDRGDVMSMLLAARDDENTGMTDRQIRDEAMTLILAGHETTANAMAWTFHLLMQHPAVFDRVRAEVDSVLAGRLPTMEDLPKLPYSLSVLKESMRLYPPAYLMGRQAIREVELGGQSIKRGAIVFVNIYCMHRRASYFEAPDAFRPERFSPENEKTMVKGAYIPFGGGERICIGNHFAMMEAHLLLAVLASRVDFTLAREPHVVPEPLVTLRPKNGLAVRVRRR
jgi:cytochrome P450